MDRVNELIAIVQREVAEYANADGWKSKLYYIQDLNHQIYMVVDVPEKDHPLVSNAGVIVMTHIENDKVIIDEDITDRPLYEALESAGIPREQIILAYAGETLPEGTA